MMPLQTYRKQIIDGHNRLNYQNEYDRIRGYLANVSILPSSTVEHLRNREKFLLSVGARNIDKTE